MFRCKVCGKNYPERPDKCEYDGLDQFVEIIEHAPSLQLKVQGGDMSMTFNLSELPLNIAATEGEQKFQFPFDPNGKIFPVRLPIRVVFGENGLVVKATEKEDAINIQVNRNYIHNEIRTKHKDNRSFEKINIESEPDEDFFLVELHLGYEIMINGLTFKILKS